MFFLLHTSALPLSDIINLEVRLEGVQKAAGVRHFWGFEGLPDASPPQTVHFIQRFRGARQSFFFLLLLERVPAVAGFAMIENKNV